MQLLGYVASARIQPPVSWATAALEALEAALPAQQQQQQQWSLPGLLAALLKLRLLPSQKLLRQLQLCAAAAQPQLSPEQVAAQTDLLQKLQDRVAAAEQQPSAEAVEQQQQQGGVLEGRAGSPWPQQAQQQQQWQTQRKGSSSASNGSSSSNGSSWSPSGQSSASVGPASPGGPWAGALWVVSSTNGSSDSSSSVSVGAAPSTGHSKRGGTDI